MTKTNSRRRSATKPAAKPAEKPETTEGRAELPEEAAALKYHHATVQGGRKFPEGTQVEVKHCFMSRHREPIAMAIVVKGDEETTVQCKHLKKGKALSDERIAEFEEERERLCLVHGVVHQESDSGKAVRFQPKGLFVNNVWIGKSLINQVLDDDGDVIDGEYEIPYWVMKQKFGPAYADGLETVE